MIYKAIEAILKRMKTRKLSAGERIAYGVGGGVLLLSAILGHNEIITFLVAHLQNVDLATILSTD